MGAAVTLPSPDAPSCPIFLINLDRDPDRLVHMGAEIGRAGMHFERIPAVFGMEMPGWIEPYFLNLNGDIASNLRRGEVGCYASHLVVARRMVDANIPLALVFEDDLELPADFRALIAAMVQLLPTGWDIVRLSNQPKSAYVPVTALPGERELARYFRVPNNTGASLLSLSGARKLLRSGLRDIQIDEHLRRPWDLGLETYGVVPAPIRSNIFEVSTIDIMHARGLSIETAMTKLARRRFASPQAIINQMRWQIARFGLFGWARCLWCGIADSARRKLTRRKPDAGAVTRLRVLLDRK